MFSGIRARIEPNPEFDSLIDSLRHINRKNKYMYYGSQPLHLRQNNSVSFHPVHPSSSQKYFHDYHIMYIKIIDSKFKLKQLSVFCN